MYISLLISIFVGELGLGLSILTARGKCLLISWLQSLSTVILEPKKVKSIIASTFPPSVYHEVMGLDAIIFFFFNTEFQARLFTLLFHPHQKAV